MFIVILKLILFVSSAVGVGYPFCKNYAELISWTIGCIGFGVFFNFI